MASRRRAVLTLVAALAASVCGLIGAGSAAAGTMHEFVVGGTQAAPGSWPSLVALVAPGGDAVAGQFCGGTLIAPTVVLTAAHCVIGPAGTAIAPGAVEVLAGTSDLSAGGDRIPVTAVHPHPSYRKVGDAQDAALLFLARPSAAPPAAYARTGQDPDAERPSAIAGWGELAESSARYPSALQAAAVTIYDGARCAQALGTAYVRGLTLCAGDMRGGVDACSGDSGGPLRDGSGMVVGIVSWGVGCGRPGLPGVYTRVSSLTSWIDRALGAPNTTPAAVGAPRVRALRAVARPGATAHLRYLVLGAGERTRETITITSGTRVIARLRTVAGLARADLEYAVGWRVPATLARHAGLSFCVRTQVVGGPQGVASCAPLRISSSR